MGYGDLTAASQIGRMISITEALVGQLYLVIVVSVLVANVGRIRPVKRAERMQTSAEHRRLPSSPRSQQRLRKRRSGPRLSARFLFQLRCAAL